MKIDVLTIFPEMFEGPLTSSIMRIARQKNILDLAITNIRDFTHDKHKTVDDRPFGGGPGMVMKPGPIYEALESVRTSESLCIYLSPAGSLFNQETARELSEKSHLVLLSGHYEGVDERIREHFIDREISIGDYVLTNGTLPAMVLIDATVRLIPGVLGEPESILEESFTNNQLEYPHYTRPRNFKGFDVPDILFSGDHGKIAEWRQQRAQECTKKLRPDLLKKKTLKTKK